MSPGDRTRAHPGTTGKAAGRLSSREETPRRLRGTDKYLPMDSCVDETQQEGTAGASVAAASERKVPTLSAVEDLDGLREGGSGTDIGGTVRPLGIFSQDDTSASRSAPIRNSAPS